MVYGDYKLNLNRSLEMKENDDSPMTKFQEVLELISGEFCINLENQTHQQLDKGPLKTPVIESVSPFEKNPTFLEFLIFSSYNNFSSRNIFPLFDILLITNPKIMVLKFQFLILCQPYP